ncbi:hypothetical protein OSB04_un000432 [Centaurea solstitialis]|uniref:GAG-pre-integrase domain-containing protein n=1 Tax=Centaurea solstitialis TaxID=347529 RepID=A0AA38SNM8_9ASTR|nr:hypothetical protein OSB04_un000432 [Centaurea solstitialis]
MVSEPSSTSTTPPATMSSSFHPALTVSNIKNHISITLEMENVQYATWAELFKIHARSHKVYHHIIKPESRKEKVPATDEEKELWATLDATVLQWIYATISNDLLHTILEPDSTAMEAWNRLRDIFQDNKHSRAVTLEQEFSHTHMEDFPTASAYCQRLKVLADQLKNVGAPVTNDRLVLQMVAGLTEAFSGVGTLLRQTDPLPKFYQARSMLILEEAGVAKKASQASPTAMPVMYRDTDDSHAAGYQPSPRHNDGGQQGNRRGPPRGNSGGGNRNRNGSRGGGRGRGGNNNSRGGGSQQNGRQQWSWPWAPWGMPPCPYPTAPWVRPPHSTSPQPGILGPRPQQAYTATGTPSAQQQQSPSLTDIESAMYTLGMTPPDTNWYMDTGATSHMTSTQGNLSSYFNLSNRGGIVVGSGHSIPIHGYGHTYLSPPNPPFTLKHVLHVPQIVKNLISVRKFVTDNSVSVEFDPFGFSVKDFRTGAHLMRCESHGDLYPITTTINSTQAKSHSAFAVIAPKLWHARLGHPGAPIFQFLRTNKDIQCNAISNTFLCSSCQLGKKILSYLLLLLLLALLCHLI